MIMLSDRLLNSPAISYDMKFWMSQTFRQSNVSTPRSLPLSERNIVVLLLVKVCRCHIRWRSIQRRCSFDAHLCAILQTCSLYRPKRWLSLLPWILPFDITEDFSRCKGPWMLTVMRSKVPIRYLLPLLHGFNIESASWVTHNLDVSIYNQISHSSSGYPPHDRAYLTCPIRLWGRWTPLNFSCIRFVKQSYLRYRRFSAASKTLPQRISTELPNTLLP